MKEYVTTATIAAPPERVWAVLADSEAYQQPTTTTNSHYER